MLKQRTVISLEQDDLKEIRSAESLFCTLMNELQEIDDSDCATMADFAQGAWANISDFLDFYKGYINGK